MRYIRIGSATRPAARIASLSPVSPRSQHAPGVSSPIAERCVTASNGSGCYLYSPSCSSLNLSSYMRSPALAALAWPENGPVGTDLARGRALAVLPRGSKTPLPRAPLNKLSRAALLCPSLQTATGYTQLQSGPCPVCCAYSLIRRCPLYCFAGPLSPSLQEASLPVHFPRKPCRFVQSGSCRC